MKRRWLTKGKIIFLIVWYLLGPKLGSIGLYAAMEPATYSMAITKVYGAAKTLDGDVIVCVDLAHGYDKTMKERIGIRLPLAASRNHPHWITWSQQRKKLSETFSIAVSPSVRPCLEPFSMKIVEDGGTGDPGRNAPIWRQYYSELIRFEELLVVGKVDAKDLRFDKTSGRVIAYLGRNIARPANVDFPDTHRSPINEDHYVAFHFPLRETGIQWKNAWAILLVPLDFIFGPLAWLLIFTPLLTGRS